MLMTQECAKKLTDDVTNIHDCLKTYMLETCLIVHLHDPNLRKRGNFLCAEQWALLIYKQLLEFLLAGELPILLDGTLGDDKSYVFKCDHHLPFILVSEHLCTCCDNRIIIPTHSDRAPA